ncbi:hypothetical protein V502_01972 [Pseudogymnoascus sp. VKM F-4520 (FW-2644)]|nr:hypothetical protein V502_01972 [Pseudogymnoascus sp. VKM F-4520 (FW-2644)]
MSLPTLAREGAQRKTRRRWDYFLDDIREDIVLESQLLLLSFATGVQDAAAWTDYSCFASNQTGNTLFLAIGVAGLANNAYSFQNIGMSLGSFVAGGLVMGQIGNQMGVRKRFWLLITSIIQTAMVFVAAAISHYYKDACAALLALFLLAFSSGAQVAMSRSLKVTEITTAMATAAYVDVVVDPLILQRHNRLRNRRVLFLAMLSAGCFAGAFVGKAVNLTLPLLLCGVCKTFVTVVFFFNRAIE